MAANRLCYTSVLGLVVCRHQGFSDADVEQRESTRLCACSRSCARSSSAALALFAAVAADPTIRMSAQGVGAIRPAALRGRVSRFHFFYRRSSDRVTLLLKTPVALIFALSRAS
jgi:hypothetical protein